MVVVRAFVCKSLSGIPNCIFIRVQVHNVRSTSISLYMYVSSVVTGSCSLIASASTAAAQMCPFHFGYCCPLAVLEGSSPCLMFLSILCGVQGSEASVFEATYSARITSLAPPLPPNIHNARTVYMFIIMQVQIIQLDEDRGEFVLRATFDHPYPTTKIMWIPDQVICM